MNKATYKTFIGRAAAVVAAMSLWACGGALSTYNDPNGGGVPASNFSGGSVERGTPSTGGGLVTSGALLTEHVGERVIISTQSNNPILWAQLAEGDELWFEFSGTRYGYTRSGGSGQLTELGTAQSDFGVGGMLTEGARLGFPNFVSGDRAEPHMLTVEDIALGNSPPLIIYSFERCVTTLCDEVAGPTNSGGSGTGTTTSSLGSTPESAPAGSTQSLGEGDRFEIRWENPSGNRAPFTISASNIYYDQNQNTGTGGTTTTTPNTVPAPVTPISSSSGTGSSSTGGLGLGGLVDTLLSPEVLLIGGAVAVAYFFGGDIIDFIKGDGDDASNSRDGTKKAKAEAKADGNAPGSEYAPNTSPIPVPADRRNIDRLGDGPDDEGIVERGGIKYCPDGEPARFSASYGGWFCT